MRPVLVDVVAPLAMVALNGGVAVALVRNGKPFPHRPARLLVLFGAALALGIVAVRFAPAGLAGAGLKAGAVLVFVALAATMQVWKDAGAVKHRASGAAH